jgi:SRSO17 transposase
MAITKRRSFRRRRGTKRRGTKRRGTKRRGTKRRGTKRRGTKRQYGGLRMTDIITTDNPNDLNEEESVLERQSRIIIN